ncbi:hypothetical protein SH661x_000962 [Planctomicrobium sp. SH661]|uniref:hypothetical protein n=1 Tax=Planctomicrobium sp. SH661 TaxID=3448124 RepID=UPI003F5B2CE1
MSCTAHSFRPAMRLLVCLACIAILWLGVLPWVGRLPPVEAHLNFMRENHIDAGAMFYSELDERVFPEKSTVTELLQRRGRD